MDKKIVLRKFIEDWLEEKYSFLHNGDFYEFKVYVDREESFYIQEHLKELDFNTLDELKDHILDMTWEQESDLIYHTANEILEDIPLEVQRKNNIEAMDIEEIMIGYDIAHAVYPMESVLEDVEVDVIVALKTMDSPYFEDSMIDFNYVFRNEIDFEDNFEEELGYNNTFKKLLESQGTTVEEFYKYFTKDDFETDNKFVKQLYQEVVNSYSGNVLAFLDTMNVIDYFGLKEGYTVTVPSGTQGGLIDVAMGGGSVLGVTLEKDITFDREDVFVALDGEHGYSVKEIYGMNNFKF